ncbi:MAG: hypothetical protein GXO49_05870, partial [Chlorobi bacterium]|nr:hypothetical protein [Chlorobiota bacterium]
KLILFFDNNTNVTIEVDENVKIRTIEAGREGGRWYLGHTITRKKGNGDVYEAKKHEYLKTDGILLYNSKTKENVIYIYNEDEKMVHYYSQTK